MMMLSRVSLGKRNHEKHESIPGKDLLLPFEIVIKNMSDPMAAIVVRSQSQERAEKQNQSYSIN